MEFIADVTFLLHVKNNHKLILAGDLNMAHIDWRTLHAGTSEGDTEEALLDIGKNDKR